MRACIAPFASLALLAGMAASAASCLPPSQSCADYVQCQQAYDPSVETAAWEAGGSCWSTPQTAAACTEQCEAALASLRQLPDAPNECAAQQ